MENQTAKGSQRRGSVLKAVVLYGELESGLKAKALLQRASHRAGWEGNMESLFWRFDVMSDTAIAREALYGAMDADMVLLVAKAMSEPPAWLLEWLQIWAISRRIQDAILAAWCDEHVSHSPASGVGKLRKLAQEHSLEFLCADDTKSSRT